MKPFQPRTVEQQRKNYIMACKRRMRAEIRDLEEAYSLSHITHTKYHVKRCDIEEQIAKIQDRVANAADKEFGGWDTWRHDPDLLATVVKRMDDAVVQHRVRIDKINERMEAVLATFRADCAKVASKYRTLIKTA
jgi:hypothetical protein